MTLFYIQLHKQYSELNSQSVAVEPYFIGSPVLSVTGTGVLCAVIGMTTELRRFLVTTSFDRKLAWSLIASTFMAGGLIVGMCIPFSFTQLKLPTEETV